MASPPAAAARYLQVKQYVLARISAGTLAVGEEVADWLAPVREAYLELRDDTDRIEDILLVLTYSGRTPDWPG